ncbi:endonuclease domain-containing 1 protein-like [Rhinoderma darwinii]|uniref:endonuclease domain-containing 1 protein-like n=1 Tax=Rhinoderma darwinii TaxID=43563 RepID=UPI003F673D7D
MKLFLGISLFFVIETHARVSDNFDNCLNFFYKNQIPSGFQGIAKSDLFDRNNFPDGIKLEELASPAYICQTFENIPRFASLYDRGRRMPLYSAYMMGMKPIESEKECSRCHFFKLEPQLAYREVTENMLPVLDAKQQLNNYNRGKKISEQKEQNRPSYLLSKSQAIDDDFKTTDYDRGHLSPCGHQTASADIYKATFTLTNVVPMVSELNKNIWSQYEVEMIEMSEKCPKMYVITGIVPGNVPIKEGGLPAPDYVWNAYCCVDNNGKPIMSGAALAENIKKGTFQKNLKINDFQNMLKAYLDVSHNIELFEGGCSPP